MSQITHQQCDPETCQHAGGAPVPGGHLVQIVSADALRRELLRNGDCPCRPHDFGVDDEWDVGDVQCRLHQATMKP